MIASSVAATAAAARFACRRKCRATAALCHTCPISGSRPRWLAAATVQGPVAARRWSPRMQHQEGRLCRFQQTRGGSVASDTSIGVSESAPPMFEKPEVAEKFRKDYKQPSYWIDEVQLDVKIFDGETKVETLLVCELNTNVAVPGAALVLDGEDLILESIELTPNDSRHGTLLAEGLDGYELVPEGIVVRGIGTATNFTLRTRVRIVPEQNTQLSGLYFSGCMYCTQMEAEGFRRFTYFLDRPDVMSKYTRVRIEADKEKCPILLGNGNEIEKGECVEDPARHYAVFQDPFAKPSYLFAMVAGKLGFIEDSFTTASGRKVKLAIFSEQENVDQLDHAMKSLKNAMTWDEARFGLEYDLDVYNIVAVNDFNMGAMENKGLNIFNTSLILARPDTATDDDYERIEGVIGHEYFHNWTGNRITCRDWFQLTLKEGLTVFRDQEFSGDMGSPAVKRIEEVRILRAVQFREDGGPMAHPIRPESYIAMDNFYTPTVYCKGAEVIRMYQTLLGQEGFRKGMDLYFERHDGRAVSCDDFRAAMADANGRDLAQFEEWYLQPGTPQVQVQSAWDPASATYRLTLRQLVGAGQAHLAEERRREKAMHIPVVVGLLDKATGTEIVPSRVLELTKQEQIFKFDGIFAEPVPSLLRDFSAPVKLDYSYSDEDLVFLAANDTDSFNRWEAAQTLSSKAIKEEYATMQDAPCDLSPGLIDAFGKILADRDKTDLSLLSHALILPAESTLIETMSPPVDPLRLHKARGAVRKTLAMALRDKLETCYAELSPAPGEDLVIDALNAGKRRLRNVCLNYLAAAKDEISTARCMAHYKEARERGCMTDKLAALQCLVETPAAFQTVEALRSFYDDADGDALVVNKWFALQAGASLDDVLMRVQRLLEHPEFTLKNPNRLRSVMNVFAGNVKGFHKADGSGYAFMAKAVLEVDKLNPQVASRLALAFSTWAKLDLPRQKLIKEQLAMLSSKEGSLSKDTYEVVAKCSKSM